MIDANVPSQGDDADRGSSQVFDPLPQLIVAQDDIWKELTRADTKAGHLLGVFGIVLAGVVALSGRSQLSDSIRVMLWISAVPMTAAWTLLLLVVRPSYQGAPYTRYSDVTVDELVEQHAVDSAKWRARRLQQYSVVLCRKFQNIRNAVHLMILGGVVLVGAGLVLVFLSFG